MVGEAMGARVGSASRRQPAVGVLIATVAMLGAIYSGRRSAA